MIMTEFEIAFDIEGMGLKAVKVVIDPDKTTNKDMIDMGLLELVKLAKPVAIREVGQWKEVNLG